MFRMLNSKNATTIKEVLLTFFRRVSFNFNEIIIHNDIFLYQPAIDQVMRGTIIYFQGALLDIRLSLLSSLLTQQQESKN